NDAKVIQDLILSSFRPRISSDLSSSPRRRPSTPKTKPRPLSLAGGEPLDELDVDANSSNNSNNNNHNVVRLHIQEERVNHSPNEEHEPFSLTSDGSRPSNFSSGGSKTKLIAAYREALRKKTSFLTFRKQTHNQCTPIREGQLSKPSPTGPSQNKAHDYDDPLKSNSSPRHVVKPVGQSQIQTSNFPEAGRGNFAAAAKTLSQRPDLLQIESRNSFLSLGDSGVPSLRGASAEVQDTKLVCNWHSGTKKHPPSYRQSTAKLDQTKQKGFHQRLKVPEEPNRNLEKKVVVSVSAKFKTNHLPTDNNKEEEKEKVPGNPAREGRSNKFQESEGSLDKTDPGGPSNGECRTVSQSISSYCQADNKTPKAKGKSSWDKQEGTLDEPRELISNSWNTQGASPQGTTHRGRPSRSLFIEESPRLKRRSTYRIHPKMSMWDAKIEPIPQKPPRAFSAPNNANSVNNNRIPSTVSNPIPPTISNMSSTTQLSPHSSCSMTSSGASSGTLSSLTSPQQGAGVSSPSASSTISSSSGAGTSSSGTSRSSRLSSTSSSMVSSIASAIENQFHTLTNRNNGNFRYSYESPSHKRYNTNHLQHFFQTQRPSSHHGTPVKQSRQTSSLLASLDKSILQIRDWLTLLQDMLQKERVDLADLSSICRMLDRQ
ncbi:hypothetical protein TCAL_11878, partial [Tigriopus californicus]